VLNSVSGKTTGLIVGEEPGNSKLSKAKKLDVPQLTEGELVELLSR
jgi:NAD-dependent DNA ligase